METCGLRPGMFLFQLPRSGTGWTTTEAPQSEMWEIETAPCGGPVLSSFFYSWPPVPPQSFIPEPHNLPHFIAKEAVRVWELVKSLVIIISLCTASIKRTQDEFYSRQIILKKIWNSLSSTNKNKWTNKEKETKLTTIKAIKKDRGYRSVVELLLEGTRLCVWLKTKTTAATTMAIRQKQQQK